MKLKIHRKNWFENDLVVKFLNNKSDEKKGKEKGLIWNLVKARVGPTKSLGIKKIWSPYSLLNLGYRVTYKQVHLFYF